MIPTTSIRIEGGLLGGDLLERLKSADLTGQKPADFGLDPKRNLTDEIAAVYSDAFLQWQLFRSRLAKLPEGDIGTTVTRENWVKPFLGFLGFDIQLTKAQIIGGQTYSISHRADPSEDSPPVHVVGYHQELGKVASGRLRMAPHSLLQEFINRDDHLWGIVTNGRQLRLLRDCTFVKRQAFIDFDLEAIFEQQRFDDFVFVYRLLHRTRFPKGRSDADQCLLETYQQTAESEGGRARDKLRDGVEECLKLLGNGFLRHPASEELRKRLKKQPDGKRFLSEENFYRQLLLLVYRFLFLLVSEERGLVSPSDTYSNHYSVSRIRRLVDVQSTWTQDDDLWQSLRVLWDALGNERLAAFLELAPLNGELFEAQLIDGCSISNADLLEAFGKLSTYTEDKKGTLRRVNYGALDVEELGSVYESLLEFHPRVEEDGSGRLIFDLFAGSERKTTGSYYTPTSLVAELVTSALVPVVEERLAKNPHDRAGAILKIRVIDPACGSGHFLLAATRYLAKELAKAKTGDDEPAPEEVRKASRDVVAHCIYGVDLNPLAVDLCRVALWLESYAEGKPLTFLDHRIRNGNGLVGVFDLNCLKEGIPDKAFEPLEGDDRAFARFLASENKRERKGQRGLFAMSGADAIHTFSNAAQKVDEIPSDLPTDIRRKREVYRASHDDPGWKHQRLACDLWTAAFFQKLQPGEPIITSGQLAEHLAGTAPDEKVQMLAMDLAGENRFFHWQLEFPDVFQTGGFDVVLANPPWEHVELKEKEFFAAHDMRIALAKNASERLKLIKDLEVENPNLLARFKAALRGQDGTRDFLGNSGRYNLAGRGRINTYAVFAELMRDLLNPDGRAGIIVPTGIATDDTTKFLFGDYVETATLTSLYDFENRNAIFPAVHRSYKFCLLTLRGRGTRDRTPAEFMFFGLGVEDLKKEGKKFRLTREEIDLLNPNTGNCPIFRSQADAELTKAIYRRVPVLWREATADRPEENPWRIKFMQGLFNMASDSHHFRDREWLEANGYHLDGNVFQGAYDNYLPLYEAKMLHQFDHRWATYDPGEADSRLVTAEEKADPNFVVQPRYWVREEIVRATIPQYPEALALALRMEDHASMDLVLLLWAYGCIRASGDASQADQVLTKALSRTASDAVEKLLIPPHAAKPKAGTGERRSTLAAQGAWLQELCPLNLEDAVHIVMETDSLPGFAQNFVDRFSPHWLMGWRDIARSTDVRTCLFSALPIAPVGHTAPLAFMPGIVAAERVGFIATMNSIVLDYAARQKVGGTHLTYGLLKQFPVSPPGRFPARFVDAALMLMLTASDMTPMAHEFALAWSGNDWEVDHRFELRCELDAAFFHLYLPCSAAGDWIPAERETEEELATLKSHFRTPRHAVSFMLDSFEVLRNNEEKPESKGGYGKFRTKERIMEIYDAMLDAQRSGIPFKSSVTPPPGSYAYAG